ncbi:MAG: rod shape-determining protein MreD [Lentisphaerae bacterium]|nr:rod shape-determining protein MreD [Lentisphaerota bacterium]
MTWIVMTITFAVATIVESMVPPVSALGQAKLPILMSVVLYYALHRSTTVMSIAALVAGLLCDALSPVPLGSSLLLFVVAGWVASRFRGLVMVDSAITGLFFGAVGGLGVTLVQGLLFLRGGPMAVSPGLVLVKTAGTALLGGCCTPLVFFAIGKLDRMAGNREPGEASNGLA